HIASDFGHGAAGLLPIDKRHRSGITALAEVDIDVVDPGGGNLHYNFVRLGLGHGKIDQSQGVRPARFLYLNGFHGESMVPKTCCPATEWQLVNPLFMNL